MTKKLLVAMVGVMFFLGLLANASFAVEERQILQYQQQLKTLGYPCECSGKMDEATMAAVKAFQKDKGLKETGELDTETCAAMEKAVAEKQAAPAPAEKPMEAPAPAPAPAPAQ